MLYHASPRSGLKTLLPHASTHGTPYVYALENPVTALLFGAKQDDFDFDISTDAAGIPTLCECYPGALETVYQGKSCSLYQAPEAGFLRSQTGWADELVSPRPVPVLSETPIPDLYARLLSAEASGALILRRYQHTPTYRRMVAAHIIDRLLRFRVDLERCLDQDPRFSTHYRALILALRSAADGHLIP